jgi:hypothetical protein
MGSDDAMFDDESELLGDLQEAKPDNKTFRAPVWITLIALFLGVFGIAFGLLEVFSPGKTGFLTQRVADLDAQAWGVRNMALGATMIAAILFRHAGGYIVGFVGAIAREGGDLYVALGDDGSGIASYLLIVILLGLEVFCLLALLAKGVKHRLS